MAIIHGTKANGRSGVLDHAELKALIYEKSGRRANEANCGTCATYIQSKSDTADGGGVTTKFGGRTVFHISSGKRGGSDGCSVFFTLTDAGGPSLSAGIVAVGWHANSDHIYRLDWGKGPPFFTGNRFDSSTQHQRGHGERR